MGRWWALRLSLVAVIVMAGCGTPMVYCTQPLEVLTWRDDVTNRINDHEARLEALEVENDERAAEEPI